MITASLSLCKELHAISGWHDTTFSWYCDEERDDTPVVNLSKPLQVVGGVGYYTHQYPAYDAAFLMGMLPTHQVMKHGNGNYVAWWCDYASDEIYKGESRTSPANALCSLAIA